MKSLSMRHAWGLAAIVAAMLLAVSGCSSMRSAETASMAAPELSFDSAIEAPLGRGGAVGGDAERSASASEPMQSARSQAAPSPQPSSGAIAVAPLASQDAVPPPDSDGVDGSSAEEPAVERKRVYSGFLGLVVGDPSRINPQIADLAESVDGYVESQSARNIVIRVPAASFDSTMAAIEAFGEVSQRVVQTADVTEQFADLEQRRDLAERTRDRLYRLLERTEDTEERVRILREIRRLTEEIERIRNTLSTLAQLVAFSRISVQLTPRITVDDAVREQIGFAWIRRLSPLAVTTGTGPREIVVSPGDAFAVFESGERFVAESADGVRFRVGTVDNDPAGEDGFWQRAVVFALEELYRSVDTSAVGQWRLVRMRSKDREPYTYVVGVRVEEELLWVAELFFPNDEAVAVHEQPLYRALEEVEW